MITDGDGEWECYACRKGDDIAAERDRYRNALRLAIERIRLSAHGDNCYLSEHYDGDPGNRCNCGKESLVEHLSLQLNGEAHESEATPMEKLAGAILNVYDHGGARMFYEDGSGDRELLIDFYHEDTRLYVLECVNSHSALLAQNAEMVELLKTARDNLRDLDAEYTERLRLRLRIDAALAGVTKEEPK
jgi:hypothetical protein